MMWTLASTMTTSQAAPCRAGDDGRMLEANHHEGVVLIDKQLSSAADAVADIPDGASIAVGGFGLSGNPMALIEALRERAVT